MGVNKGEPKAGILVNIRDAIINVIPAYYNHQCPLFVPMVDFDVHLWAGV